LEDAYILVRSLIISLTVPTPQQSTKAITLNY